MIRIGIDYRFAVRTSRGIGVYIREIVRQLMLFDPVNQYILYLDEDAELEIPHNFSKKVLPYKNILLFEQIYLPRQAHRDRLNVIWYPSNSGPLILHHSVRLIVTVHDMISFMQYNSPGLSFKSLKYRAGEYYRRYILKKGFKRIDQLTTVSEFSALEIKTILNRRAIVIPNHIKHLGDSATDMSILQKHNLEPAEYFFSMTGDAPHKNLKGLLDIFSQINTQKKLVISGVKTRQVVEKYPEELQQRVIVTGYITEEEKAALYQNTYAFLFLSLYEGFGIPLLEAMQYHVPVIASNRSSIPEILGEGGFLINPQDPGAVIDTINNLVHYDKPWFAKVQDKQLMKFSSWASSALKLHQIFKDLKQRGVSV